MEGLAKEAIRFSALAGIAFSAIMLLRGILMLAKRKKLRAEPADDPGEQITEEAMKTMGASEPANFETDMNSYVQIR